MAQLRRRKDSFDQLGAQVVLAGLGSVGEIADLMKRFEVPKAMIADPERRLFEVFGLNGHSPNICCPLG